MTVPTGAKMRVRTPTRPILKHEVQLEVIVGGLAQENVLFRCHAPAVLADDLPLG